MRQGHFLLIFCAIYISCYLFLLMEQERYDRVVKEKKKVETALLEAAEHAGEKLVASIRASPEKRKSIAEMTFLESLYVSLGMLDSQEEQQQLKMYLPMLILVEEDGAYFYYMQQVFGKGGKGVRHEWSEKIMFSFSDDAAGEVKKKCMLETLEKTASGIITEHNYIASQYGLSYSFSAPSFVQCITKVTQLPMLIAVFQGWPLNPSKDVVYENCIDSGVYLKETEKFLVEMPVDLTKAICIYHREGCTELEKSGKIVKEYVSKQEAIYQYGAFSCEKCGY